MPELPAHDWDLVFLAMAKSISKSSTCLRKRFGAVIVRDHQVVSAGANGAPDNCPSCINRGVCYRIANNIPRGTDYTKTCRSIHAEQQALIMADRSKLKDATLYLYGHDNETGAILHNPDCCAICKRLIINSGISTVVFADPDIGVPGENYPFKARTQKVRDWTGDDCDDFIMGGY